MMHTKRINWNRSLLIFLKQSATTIPDNVEVKIREIIYRKTRLNYITEYISTNVKVEQPEMKKEKKCAFLIFHENRFSNTAISENKSFKVLIFEYLTKWCTSTSIYLLFSRTPNRFKFVSSNFKYSKEKLLLLVFEIFI